MQEKTKNPVRGFWLKTNKLFLRRLHRGELGLELINA
jgi:hypothetical protein